MKKKISPDHSIERFAKMLSHEQQSHGINLPLKNEAKHFVDDLFFFLFPGFSESVASSPKEIIARLTLLQCRLNDLLQMKGKTPMPSSPHTVTKKFFARLPEIYAMLGKDAEAIERGDPAAESVEEVILAYPGFYAIAMHRIAHEFYRLRVPVLPRLIAEYAHQMTGIDIHPGARIGSPFFIDHGTGVVIGETATIGKNVKIYQGVTLGALSVDKKQANMKRHPTIEDNVIIYAQAVILGGNTVIGHDSVIGGNVWLLNSVPAFSVVYSESKINVQKKENKEKL